ncbi:MAG: 1,4-dihydroxy-2-naphthoate octaprenyltransferase [Paludibacteraceae bacterium]|nr:1,4-dihydroxy-2-naphthoate octaprenyltransferase [Paludibacteraceae bacterium]
MSPYITSLRLRTLPLSVAGIILGSGLAYNLSTFNFQLSTFLLAVLTALCLQILSNLSNELGDALKGTDADQHGREAYGLQAGTITVQQMKRMIILFVILSVLFGTALIGVAFWDEISLSPFTFHLSPFIFLLLGALAIIGAIKYTLGKHSYGYMGLGDLGVFLFFGLLSTMGAYYLQTQTLTWEVFWAGVAIGLPCVGVLNLNNIRDMYNDRAYHKHTLASALGPKGARIYHSLLLIGAMMIMVLYGHYWTLCVLPVWCWNLSYLWTQPESKLDKQMPVLMFSTLVFSVLACL